MAKLTVVPEVFKLRLVPAAAETRALWDGNDNAPLPPGPPAPRSMPA